MVDNNTEEEEGILQQPRHGTGEEDREEGIVVPLGEEEDSTSVVAAAVADAGVEGSSNWDIVGAVGAAVAAVAAVSMMEPRVFAEDLGPHVCLCFCFRQRRMDQWRRSLTTMARLP